MTIGDARHYLIENLQKIYDASEAENIAVWVLEALTGYGRPVQKMKAQESITTAQNTQLDVYTAQLMQHRPVQYVLGECYFMDMKLFVDENVLVPRPETEELVDWVIRYCRSQDTVKPVILDIGTGSGCIALALKKHIPGAVVTAIDISAGALSVARKNAGAISLEIDWREADMLDRAVWETLPVCDIIISNPPYITLPEKEAMLPHVLAYEPHTALFVTDHDPQQFYKSIEAFAKEKLQQEGALFMELHRDFAKDTQRYYEQNGWKTLLRKDMQENDRMLMGKKK